MWPGSGDPAADEGSLPDIASLTIEPPADPADVREAVNHQLGIGARRVRYQPPDPHVQALREELGI